MLIDLPIDIQKFNKPVLSDVEEFQVELVDPEYKQAVFIFHVRKSELSLSEIEPFEDELVNENDEFFKIACFTSCFNIKNIVYSSIQEQLPYCTTLLHRLSKRKKCDYIHNLSNGNIDHVCIGTHNHPPPHPEKIPADIKANLQALINQ
ncbi:14576_t:CDS:2, partial [Dentiscutata heterogama]